MVYRALVLLTLLFSQSSYALNVCVYFDKVEANPTYRLGEIYSVMFQNLLGHFKEVTILAKPAIEFKKGEDQRCDRIVYLGSYFEAPLPQDFLKAVAETKKPVLWLNYNIWNLRKWMGEKAFTEKSGFEFLRLQGFDDPATKGYDPKDPGFFRFFNYKGVKFRKLNLYHAIQKKVIASPEIALVKPLDARVVSVAEHNKTGEKTPYLLQKKNFWFMADIPFSFIHEMDRYLIICDVLFDFLELPPRIQSGKRRALIRIEDIGAEYEVKTDLIYQSVKAFKERGISFGMSVIPKYIDQFGYSNGGGPYAGSLYTTPKLRKALKYAVVNGGRVIYHGYTHHTDGMINAESGVSGSDYEFWDNFTKAPVEGESGKWVLDRLEAGLKILNDNGLSPVAWVTPHYEASPLAYRVFAKFFERTIQRGRYFPAYYQPEDKIAWAGQFFPYTIYKDVYGQFIWPESLGNVNAPIVGYYSPTERTPQMVLEAAKAQLVVRDGWGSLFWHPFLIEELGIQSLTDILDGMLAMGYEFVDIEKLRASGD